MADYDKLVDLTTKGLACLCFRNKNKLSIKEITELFSEYGNVVGVNCAGNEEGFRFVRYRTEEEALKCAIAMNNNPNIKLEPVRNRISNQNQAHDQFGKNKKTNFNAQRNDQGNFQAEESERTVPTNGSLSFHNSKNKSNHKWRNVNELHNNYNVANNLDDGTSSGRFDDQRFVSNDRSSTMKHLHIRQNQNSTNINLFKYERGSIEMNNEKLQALSKLRGTHASTFQPPSNCLISNVSSVPIISSPPSSNCSTKGQSVIHTMPPPLIASIPLPELSAKEKIEVVETTDVIVANIHSNLGVSDIYEMLRNFNPIYVSDIKTVPDINVRFCHVYFDNPTDASRVEQSFDRELICGLNLIILSSHRLEAEAQIFSIHK